MPSQKERESVAKWKRRISTCKKQREPYELMWEEAFKLYKAVKKKAGDRRVASIFIRFILYFPRLYSQMPKIIAKAKTVEDMANAEIIEAAIVDILVKANFSEEMITILLWLIVTGTSFIKIGHFSKIEDVDIEDEKENKKNEILNLVMETFPFPDDNAKEKFRKTSLNSLTREIVTEHGLWADHVKNQDIFFDNDSEKFESCKWVAHRIKLTRADFKKLAKEHNWKNVEISENDEEVVTVSGIDSDSSDVKGDSDLRRIVIYEIWDKENGRRYVIAEGADKFLLDEEWPYELKGYPFEMITLYPDSDTLYGMSKVILLDDMVDLKNMSVRRAADNAERAKSGTRHEKGAFDDPDQQSNYLEAVEKGLVEVGDLTKFQDFATPALPREVFNIGNMADMVMDLTSHISNEDKQVQGRKETATKTNIRAAKGNAITTYESGRIESAIERTVRKMVPMIKQFYVWEEIVRIDSRLGKPARFEKWTGSKIGEYDFSIKAGSAAWKDEGLKMEQAKGVVVLTKEVAQAAQGLGFDFNPTPILKESFRKMFDYLEMSTEIVEEAFSPPQAGSTILGGENTGGIGAKVPPTADVPMPGKPPASAAPRIDVRPPGAAGGRVIRPTVRRVV